MRIVSLLPAATEIAYLIGLGDSVVGVSHECDFPPEARAKARITKTRLHNDLSSEAIDASVKQQLASGGELYQLDLDAWFQSAPDLVLTQKLCDVCAISTDSIARATGLLPKQPVVLTFEPESLDDLFREIELLGKATGTEAAADSAIRGLRQRVEAVVERVAHAERRPSVLCLEWLRPPFRAGHWIPDLVRMAGGDDRLGQPRQRSTELSWEDIIACDPELIVIMCCGFDIARTLQDVELLKAHPAWNRLRAVQNRRVFAVDGNHYFSRPGPRLVDSLEIMASILHPELFPERRADYRIAC